MAKKKLVVTIDDIDKAGLLKLSYNTPVVPPNRKDIENFIR
jgi:hypothetical protein